MACLGISSISRTWSNVVVPKQITGLGLCAALVTVNDPFLGLRPRAKRV